MNLPYDFARCDGKGCDERDECARYLQRNTNTNQYTPRMSRPPVIVFFCEYIVPVARPLTPPQPA